MSGAIYCLYSTQDGQPRYVGRTTDKVSYRFKQHVTAALEKEPGALYDWVRDVWRSGFDIAAYRLQGNVIEKDLQMFEEYWISQFEDLLNIRSNAKTTKNSVVADQIANSIKEMLDRSRRDSP